MGTKGLDHNPDQAVYPICHNPAAFYAGFPEKEF
jgi:hypothetical protein